MLEIGKDEGTITAKDIRFYNPTKKSKNEIHIVYLPEKGINNVNNLKMYVEFYNSKKTIIYRYPFMSDETLERKIQKTYKLKLNEKLYSEATYAKVSIIKDEEFNKTTDTLVCTNNFEDGSFYVSQKITYNFSDKGLINYQVSRKAEKQKESNPELEEDSAKYTKIFKSEAETMKKTNLTEITYDENSINYTIDLMKIDLGKSKYEKLYEIGSIKRQVKLSEESKNWSCK